MPCALRQELSTERDNPISFGDADAYGLDDLSTGLMFTHLSGRAIWDVVFDVTRAGGFVVMPIGCPVGVLDERDAEHVPS